MLLPLGFFRFVDEKKRGLRLLALGCFICAGGGVLLAFSRGAIAALVVVFAMAVCMRVIRTRLLVIGSILGMIVLLAIPQVWTRLASVADISTMLSETHDRSVDSSIRGRVTEMIAAAQIFTDHPVIGVGPGMYKEYSLEYGNRLGIRKLDEARRAHSLYLEIAAENGLLGLLALLGVFFVTLSGLNVARKRCFHHHPEMANMVTAYMLAVIAYMASALFLHMSYVRFIYLILALAAAATYVANRESMKVPVIERRST
jgi:O-antigen ligase